MTTRCLTLVVIFSAVLFSACSVKTVDIKERAIFTTDRDPYSPTVICAEPSPDAISAIAGELIARASAPGKGNAELGGAFRESAAYVGLRTQSIQLLRDSMYRICEGYMNRALSDAQVEILMRRSQKYMIALLAIEQMAGSVQAPPVTVNTAGRADLVTSLTEIVNQRDEADKKATAFEAEKEALSTELKTTEKQLVTAKDELKIKNKAEDDDSKKIAESDYEPIQLAQKKIEEAQAKLKAKEKELASATSLRDTLNTAIAAAKSSSLGGSTSASIMVIPEKSGPSDDVVKYSTYAIANLVSAVISTDDMGAVCLAHVTRGDPKDNNEDEGLAAVLSSECTSFFSQREKMHELSYRIKSAEAACFEKAYSATKAEDQITYIKACSQAFRGSNEQRYSEQTAQITPVIPPVTTLPILGSAMSAGGVYTQHPLLTEEQKTLLESLIKQHESVAPRKE